MSGPVIKTQYGHGGQKSIKQGEENEKEKEEVQDPDNGIIDDHADVFTAVRQSGGNERAGCGRG